MSMSTDEEFLRLSGIGPRDSAPGPLAKALTWIVGAAVLAGALVLSALLISVLLVVGAVVGGWLWWQTRALRRRLREQLQQSEAGKPGARPEGAGRSDGEVIEGDFIRETKP